MDATLAGDVVRAGPAARERFYDARGYGRPVDGGRIELAPVEAAHLLYRGDLSTVDGMDVGAFLASAAVSEVAFFAYKDLRDRGFYLSPTATAPPGATEGGRDRAVDFLVYPRGAGPWDGEIAHRVRVASERETVPADALGECVLAVVDEESELTYVQTSRRDPSGTWSRSVPDVRGDLLADRVLCWDPPAALYEESFYGQRVGDAGDAVQLSLVEATHLARAGTLVVEGGAEPLLARGRDVEGDRFDRRLRAYETLRNAGVVPKTGFKFGADFRTYADLETVAEVGHAEFLVRVVPADHGFDPRALALDVRLAHGVRKTMLYALVGPGAVRWLSAERLTP